ncbi:MAG: type II secretion system protein [Candidatus Paceibacterota bacterium]
MKKGFTLVEILIVIGIMSILFNAVIVALNPQALFKNARDTQRLSDIAVIRSALLFYLSQSPNPSLENSPSFVCGTNFGASSADAASSPFVAPTLAHGGVRSIDGTGWIPIDLESLEIGSIAQSLPIDPVNNSEFFYAYSCDQTNLKFELNAKLESEKFQQGEDQDKHASDAGDNDQHYEIGTSLIL